MKNMKKKSLFGGALLTAGFISSSAAADIAITGFHSTGHYLGAASGDLTHFPINADFWSQTRTLGTSFALSEATASSITDYVFTGDTGLAYTFHFTAVTFEVDTDTAAVIEWDFTGDIDPFDERSDSFIDVSGPDGQLANGTLLDPVGSVEVNLLAGETYSFRGQAVAFGTDSGASYWSITIVPSPSSLALVGVAALCGGRHRRRE